MSSSYSAYRLLTACGSLVLIPLIWLHHRFRGKDPQRFYQRIGVYPHSFIQSLQGRPRIWIHAVSVGEAGVAAAIGNSLKDRYPDSVIALSTIREQGYARARELMQGGAECFFAPLDLVGPTRKALHAVRPDLLILLETEIWPNLIVNAKRMGTRIAIINGRISPRSISRYRKVRSLMRYTLSHIDAFSMISDQDAQRIQSLGAPADRIRVNGNAKFDCPDPLEETDARKWVDQVFGFQENTPVFVAGSTRHPEEQIILDAFLKIRALYPQTVLIIAPRHIERTGQIVQWTSERGLRSQLRSELDGARQRREAEVVILDTIGELSAVYSVANMVFCGGSLVPKGGQNIMEPAMWGKPVCYGPSMEDFADARQVIQACGGGVQVKNADQIATIVSQWLRYPKKAIAAGQAARQAILPHRGAALKHVQEICRLLP